MSTFLNGIAVVHELKLGMAEGATDTTDQLVGGVPRAVLESGQELLHLVGLHASSEASKCRCSFHESIYYELVL